MPPTTATVKATRRPENVSTNTARAINNLESMWKQVEEIRTRIQGACLHGKPPGSFTTEEYATRFHLCVSTARYQLMRMVDDGVLRIERALIPDSIGRISMRNVYTPIIKV